MIKVLIVGKRELENNDSGLMLKIIGYGREEMDFGEGVRKMKGLLDEVLVVFCMVRVISIWRVIWLFYYYFSIFFILFSFEMIIN